MTILILPDTRPIRTSASGSCVCGAAREGSPRGYAMERSSSWGATCPARARSHVTTRPKTNPPTWAKNATPPPFAEALNSPKLASISWYKNQTPRQHVAEDVVPAAVQEHGGDPAGSPQLGPPAGVVDGARVERGVVHR